MSFETPLRRTAVTSPDRAAATPVRLTRRGRLVLMVSLLTLLLLAFGLGRASGADAGSGAAVTRPSVVVQPGDTLWRIARRIAPDADPRVTVDRIERLNDLRGPVQPGQHLTLP